MNMPSQKKIEARFSWMRRTGGGFVWVLNLLCLLAYKCHDRFRNRTCSMTRIGKSYPTMHPKQHQIEKYTMPITIRHVLNDEKRRKNPSSHQHKQIKIGKHANYR
jgi:hypothetical protein